MSMIKIRNLSVYYDGDIKALDHIDLDITKHCTVIIGQNGSGKSTLLQSLVGIVESDGLIEVNGVNKDIDINGIRNKVGMIFQNPDHQLFMSSIYDDLAFGLINQGIDEKTRQKRIEETAKQLNISHLLKRSTHQLSGGQKRMAAIGTILVMNQEVILMDEPSSYLDPKSRRQVINLINELDDQLIIATHDLDMAIDIADEIIILNEGKVVKVGNIDLLKDKQLLEENGLELPFCYTGMEAK
jgi:cobalt/nickel transport system ATP-binding protein